MRTTSVFLSLMFLSSAAVALEVGDQAPEVALQEIDGGGSIDEASINVRLSGDFLLLEFVDLLCQTCRDNLPRVARLADDRSELSLRQVALGADLNDVYRYISEHRDIIDFPVAADTDGSAAEAFEVDGAPILFLINSDNEIIYIHSGAVTARTIDHILSLLETPPAPTALGEFALPWLNDDLGASTFDSSHYGGKVLVFHMLWYGCGWSHRVEPLMQSQIFDLYQNEDVIMIDLVGDTRSNAQRWLARHEPPYPVINDSPRGRVFSTLQGGRNHVPLVGVVDCNRNVVFSDWVTIDESSFSPVRLAIDAALRNCQ